MGSIGGSTPPPEIDRGEDMIVLHGRMMCEECDAFLGYSHAAGCSLEGVVVSGQATEKMTTVENSSENPETSAEVVARVKEDPPPAREVSTGQMMRLLAAYVENAGEGFLGMAFRPKDGADRWVVTAEFGREAPDSPMVGGAAYGVAGDLREALEVAGSDCGLWVREASAE